MQGSASQTQLIAQIELSLARLRQTDTMFAAASEQERELAKLVSVIRDEAARLSASLTAPQLPAIQTHLATIYNVVDVAQRALGEEQAEPNKLSDLASQLENIEAEPAAASLAAAAKQWTAGAMELIELIRRAEDLTLSTAKDYADLVEEIRDVGSKLSGALTPTGRGGYREPPF